MIVTLVHVFLDAKIIRPRVSTVSHLIVVYLCARTYLAHALLSLLSISLFIVDGRTCSEIVLYVSIHAFFFTSHLFLFPPYLMFYVSVVIHSHFYLISHSSLGSCQFIFPLSLIFCHLYSFRVSG